MNKWKVVVYHQQIIIKNLETIGLFLGKVCGIFIPVMNVVIYVKHYLNNMKHEHYAEYEIYMKCVTDNFISMNSDSINTSEWCKETSVFHAIIWDGVSINYSFDLDCSLALTGLTLKEIKNHNFEISKKYLQINSLTYDEWFKKYKVKHENS